MTVRERREFAAEVALLRRRRRELDERLRRRGLLAPTVMVRGPREFGERVRAYVR